MSLAESTLKTVETTAPAVAAQGPTLTRDFYQRMFTNNPEVKDIFNLNHQRDLRQPKALFDSIVAYALNIRKINSFYLHKNAGPAEFPIAKEHMEALAGFFSVVERIAQKHASFGIKGPQYSIVGSNLLQTIQANVTKDETVLAEWGKAYEFLANIFIKREAEIYSEVEARRGGFRPTRTFRVSQKKKLNEAIVQFRLVPASEKAKEAPVHLPGQYLAIFARNPQFFPLQEIRQYSIVSAPGSVDELGRSYYEIAVKRDELGTVSRYLQEHVNENDCLELSPPYGDFFLNYVKGPVNEAATSMEYRKLHNTTFNFFEHKLTPIVFISGGIGQTPVLSMLRFLAEEEGVKLGTQKTDFTKVRKIFWIHSEHETRIRAFKEDVDKLKSTALPQLTVANFVTAPTGRDAVGTNYDFEGRVDFGKTPEIFAHEASEDESAKPFFMFCGPEGFMATVEKQLKARNIPDSRIHFEMFGPFRALE